MITSPITLFYKNIIYALRIYFRLTNTVKKVYHKTNYQKRFISYRDCSIDILCNRAGFRNTVKSNGFRILYKTGVFNFFTSDIQCQHM